VSAVLQKSSVQPLLSSQLFGLVFWQRPLAQWSFTVQGLPSSQATVLGVYLQPAPAWQVSSVHGLLSLQVAAVPPVQAVALHFSPTVHGSPSSQSMPSLAATATQPPPEHIPTAHWVVMPEQSMRACASHAPFCWPLHKYMLQPSAVMHSVVFATLRPSCTQPVADSHVSAVQTLPSSQFGASAPVHVPELQVSTVVHMSPSSQLVPSLALA
jgi:hypothetical protein